MLTAIQFFNEIAAGREPDDLLLPKDDGTVWGKSPYARDMDDAVKKAKMPKGTTIYTLRSPMRARACSPA